MTQAERTDELSDGVLRVPLRGGLAGGRFALIDADDADRVLSRRWHLSRQGYAVANLRAPEGRGAILMHRLVMPPRPGLEVDHINLNRLDNRKANLREATHSQNVRNTGRRVHSRWPYKGVRHNGASWTARIRHLGQETFLGAFASAEDAARAYDRAARSRFGCFARTNDVDKRPTGESQAGNEGDAA